MKILITGGAGYIGSRLVQVLSQQKDVDEIVIYDSLVRNNYGVFLDRNIQPKVRFVQADILDNHTLKQVCREMDIIYHLAAKVVMPDSDNDSQFFEQTNNWGTAAVVQAARDSDVKQFIYLSSVYVYGSGPEVQNVTSIPMPNSFYGISKLRGEEHVATLPNPIQSYIIRSGSVYGFSPATRFDVLINKFIFSSYFFNQVSIYGEGNQTRPFIHVDKLVESLSKIPNSSLSPGLYNLVEHNVSVNEVVEAIQKIKPELEYNHMNRHIRMKDIIVECSPEIITNIPYTSKSFAEELSDCYSNFFPIKSEP